MPENKNDPVWSPSLPGKPQSSPWDVQASSSVKPPPPKKEWMGKPILSPKHADDLELKSAVQQFALKQPKAQAEQNAYKEYISEHSRKAASHHLSGIQAALGQGDKASAQKHGVLYNMHMRQLGHDPISPPPEDIMLGAQKPKSYKFSGHPADLFLAQPFQKTEAPGMLKLGAKAEKQRPAVAKLGTPQKMPKMGKLGQELASMMTPPAVAPLNPVGDKSVMSGKEHIQQLKLQTGQPKADLSWKSRSPIKKFNLTRDLKTKSKDQIISEGIALLGTK